MKRHHPVSAPNAKLIAGARKKTSKVQKELEAAEAELHMSNAVLAKSLPEDMQKDNVVALALVQNAAVEEKVHEAAEELQVVTELLKGEEAERVRLEHELAGKAPQAGTSGEGANSALAHLIRQEQRTRSRG
jgi:NADH:ubiquinone oxidoreductase subunit C